MDFLPVFCSAIALIFTLVKRRAGHLLITPTDLLVLISVLLIGSVLFKGLATAWYIFMPALLFFIGTFGNMPTGRAAVHSLIGFAILVALLIFGGWDRLSDRVALKAENNAQLIKNEKAFNILLGNYPEIEKCGKSVHLDILVPNITGRTQYLPARLSLRQRSMKIWEEPDYLVVNKYLQDNGSSPLLNFVVKESISNYGIIAKNQELAIYKHNHLKCPTNKK